MQLIPLQGGVSTPIKSPTAAPPRLKCDCTDEISVEEETSMLWSKGKRLTSYGFFIKYKTKLIQVAMYKIGLQVRYQTSSHE
ncbi:hypothetical protein F2Q70_00036957 [Brassica cretica]|uniref:Uncharacterized protein n=1 Tax=Brassica cretica TaxID=69181 RepID=A0A8S9JYI9_BRACR|nr:hypothetical protein F2Q70_00036957 [Brassica cretica]